MTTLTPKADIKLPANAKDHYVAMKVLPDGRICGIIPLLFHYSMQVGVHRFGYEDRYCYATFEGAVTALDKWTGDGDPEGWHRHLATGRRRDLETGKEWIAD